MFGTGMPSEISTGEAQAGLITEGDVALGYEIRQRADAEGCKRMHAHEKLMLCMYLQQHKRRGPAK